MLQLLFQGGDAAPETLDARQTLSVALAYIEALVAVAVYDWATDQPPFKVTLLAVTRGSLGYDFGNIPTPVPRMSLAKCEDSWKEAPAHLANYCGSVAGSPKPLRHKLSTLLEHTRALPSEVNAVIHRDREWSWSLTEAVTSKPTPLITTRSTFRAIVLAVGGKQPRVRLSCVGDTNVFSIRAPTNQAQEAGRLLYKPVEVTASLTRALTPPQYQVIDGTIEQIRAINRKDAVEEFDNWYRRIGRPLLNDGDEGPDDGQNATSLQ